MSKTCKFSLGFLVGAAVGATIVYFLDENKRNRFVDEVNNTAGKLKDGVVEGYYDAKNRYARYREKLTSATADMLHKAEDCLEDVD